MLRHHDPAPEPLLDRVGLGERPALVRAQDRRHGRASVGVEVGRDARPIERRDPLRDDGCAGARDPPGGRGHPFASRSSKTRLRSTPQR